MERTPVLLVFSEAAVGIKRTTSYRWPSGTVYRFPLKDTFPCPLTFQLGWREWDQALENEESYRGVGEQDGLFKENSSDLVYFLYQPNIHGIFISSKMGLKERDLFLGLAPRQGFFEQKWIFLFYSKRPTKSFAFPNTLHYAEMNVLQNELLM